MAFNLLFFLNNALLGIGLAMDAFSVSLANGLAEPNMHRRRRLLIAGTFAFFQFAMPLTGWLLVSFANSFFGGFSVYIPWIALLLLCLIGGKLLIDGIKGIREEYSGEEHEDTDSTKLGFAALLLQGVATSIDALSVGFTIAEYDLVHAIVAGLVIAFITLIICLCGIAIGRRFGTALAGKAAVLGGVILICVGIEIFISGIIKYFFTVGDMRRDSCAVGVFYPSSLLITGKVRRTLFFLFY